MGDFKVLIIEDDKDTAVFFQTVLTLVGFEPEIILTAKEALARLAAVTPDMILLDLHLGFEIGGDDILYQIRSNTRFDNTRVIIITSDARRAELVTNLADLILLKPVEVEQLQNLSKRMSSFEYKPERLSFRDPITQLFNKDFFLTRLDLAFERTRRKKDFLYAAAVFVFGPLGLHNVQTNPDILMGLLREIAERFRRNLRPTDTITRVEGWKFAAILEDLSNQYDTDTVLQRLMECISAPYDIQGVQYSLAVQYGSAVSIPRFVHPNDIMDAAEQVLSKAEQPS